MMLLRSRHAELDKWRDPSYGFCHSWLMFFGTVPPGIHPAGVFFTEKEAEAFADGMPSQADKSGSYEVEPYDGNIHNEPSMGYVHRSGKET